MKTNIDINDELLEEAFSVGRMRSKKDLIHEALLEYIKLKKKKRSYRISRNNRIL